MAPESEAGAVGRSRKEIGAGAASRSRIPSLLPVPAAPALFGWLFEVVENGFVADTVLPWANGNNEDLK